MKRTKQMLSLFAAAVMLLSLAACGPAESAAPTPAAASPNPCPDRSRAGPVYPRHLYSHGKGT